MGAPIGLRRRVAVEGDGGAEGGDLGFGGAGRVVFGGAGEIGDDRQRGVSAERDVETDEDVAATLADIVERAAARFARVVEDGPGAAGKKI